MKCRAMRNISDPQQITMKNGRPATQGKCPRLDELDHDVTLWVEHFPYEHAIAGQQYLRHVAREAGITLG